MQEEPSRTAISLTDPEAVEKKQLVKEAIDAHFSWGTDSDDDKFDFV